MAVPQADGPTRALAISVPPTAVLAGAESSRVPRRRGWLLRTPETFDASAQNDRVWSGGKENVVLCSQHHGQDGSGHASQGHRGMQAHCRADETSLASAE